MIYIVIASSTREDFIGKLMGMVEDTMQFTYDTFICKTDLTTRQLYERFAESVEGKDRLIVMDVDTRHMEGWVPVEVVEYIANARKRELSQPEQADSVQRDKDDQ